MTKLGAIVGRKPSVPTISESAASAEKAAAAEILASAAGAEAQPKPVLELDNDLFLPLAAQLGEENENIRNLLIDVEHKLNELDAVKNSIGRLIEPVSKTLRALEETKSEKISLQSSLNNTRISNSNLRSELASAEKKIATLESECARLREAATVTQQKLAALESGRAEQSAELAARRTQVQDLQRRIQQQTADLQLARDENRRLGERITAADKRTVQLESEVDATRQKLQVAEKERATIQKSLDKSFAELQQVSQRLLDTDKALAATQIRLQKAEAALAEAEAERQRLITELDDVKQKHQAEITSHKTNYETLQARAALTEKMLEEARQSLMERAEEIRAFDRKLADSTRTHAVIGEKLGLIEEALAERNARIRELEHARATLAEQYEAATKAVATRENAYNRAQEQIVTLEERIQLLEAEIKAIRQANETELEVLNAKLQREQIARTMAEAAVEAGRKDIARLLQELASLQYRPAGQGVADAPEATEPAATGGESKTAGTPPAQAA
jgi:chromosome segregation ATPase